MNPNAQQFLIVSYNPTRLESFSTEKWIEIECTLNIMLNLTKYLKLETVLTFRSAALRYKGEHKSMWIGYYTWRQKFNELSLDFSRGGN